MSRKYKFHNPESLYFISFATVYWIDVFIRNEYKCVMLDSWRYCQKEKGLDNNAEPYPHDYWEQNKQTGKYHP